MKITPPLEKQEEADIINAYRMADCTIVSFAQARATRQTPGIPDLKVYDQHTNSTWWHEVKRRQGDGYKRVNSVQSPAQKSFQDMCESCGEEYIIGPLDAALTKLRAMGRIL